MSVPETQSQLDSWRNVCDLKPKFDFFRRSHRWVSGTSVAYLVFLSAGDFIISFGVLQESSSLFFVGFIGFIVVVKEIYTSVACDIGDMF